MPPLGWLWPSDDYENYSDDDYEDGFSVTITITRVLLLLRDHLFVKHWKVFRNNGNGQRNYLYYELIYSHYCHDRILCQSQLHRLLIINCYKIIIRFLRTIWFTDIMNSQFDKLPWLSWYILGSRIDVHNCQHRKRGRSNSCIVFM